MIKNSIALLLLLIFGMSSCSANKKKTTKVDKIEMNETMKKDDINSRPLESRLHTRSKDFSKKAPAEILEKFDKGIEGVTLSGALEKALKVGDKAIDFTLINQKKESVTLSQELKKGPVILIWYRGGWCPYCNLTLQYLQRELPNFKKAGATLIALTPELPDKSLSTTEKNELQFTVLSDIGNKVGEEYGLIYKLTKDVAEIYQNNFDLHGFNGDASDQLPLAATYIVDTDGIIKYAFLNADYKKRAEPKEILKALKALK